MTPETCDTDETARNPAAIPFVVHHVGTKLVVTDAQPTTFEAFYASEYLGAVRFAYLILSELGVAEEVAQDAFVALHGRWAQLDRPAAYLRTTVVNGCRDVQRRRGRLAERQHLLVGDDRTEDRPDELADVLALLPLRQRAALVLRFWAGLSEAEIAEVLGVRPGTVKSLVHRGLAQLRKEIRP